MSDLTLIPGDGDRDGPRGEWEGDLDAEGAAFQAHASTAGREWKHRTEEFLLDLGAQISARKRPVSAYRIDFEIQGPNGLEYAILAHGTFDDNKNSGLRRTDTVKKMGYDALQIHKRLPGKRIIAIVSHFPKAGSAAEHQLADLSGVLYDVIAIHDIPSVRRLEHHLRGSHLPERVGAPWERHEESFVPGLFDDVNYEED